MRSAIPIFAAALLLPAILVPGSTTARADTTIPCQVLDPATYGPSYIESMPAAVERDRTMPRPPDTKSRNGRSGEWVVPSRGATHHAASGAHYAVNKWGDTHMGIGFPGLVSVHGAFFAGQEDPAVWTTGIHVIGYRAGQIVAQTSCFEDIGREPKWFAMDLQDVDWIEILADPAVMGGGWYAMDDLTYSLAANADERIVVDFDDLPYKYKLTGSGYADLIWETGRGDFEAVHSPQRPLETPPAGPAGGREAPAASGTRAEQPTLVATYQGVIRGDAESMSFPPDTDGAIGPNHYVETVNRNFAVYDKATGEELINILLGAFLPGSNGDPRVVFDQYSDRWIIHVTDFYATATIFLAVSLTDDPTGDWFKTSFPTDEDEDAGKWPDYPTLGVDNHGIYIGAYMVGGGMSIFAIEKTPLIAPEPSLGLILAWRELPWEGAIQPAHTYGSSNMEYFVSLDSSSALRIRRLNRQLGGWNPEDLGSVGVPSFGYPPNAPALGSTVPLNTVDDRLMMSVYRDGSLWTAHTIDVDGRAGCRWYEIDPGNLTLIQTGTVADSSLYYYFPSLMVNADGDVVMGFTGSNASQYAACYYTGRRADDPPGEMAEPVMFKEGTGPQNNIDGYGRNRWGDYSYTTLDPDNETIFWTIQEYGHAEDIWGTYIAVLTYGPLDCNDNGIPDDEDIASGFSADCNLNGVPDECESQEDCNENGVLDFCELFDGSGQDCNVNGVLDECDISAGTSLDCQPNGVPDECEIGTSEVVISFPLDADPEWTTQGSWAFGQPTGGGGAYGGPDPTSGHTGANVYGYNLYGDYTSYMSETHLTSDPLDCSSMTGVTLSFWRWLGVESPTYDHAYVRVSNDGSNWVTVWENTSEVTDSSWQYQEFDVSGTADGESTVYLRWTMGPTDSAWQYCGWNIDDIELRGAGTGGGEGDCNGNGIPDECDIAAGVEEDCNMNGVPDSCDIASGTSLDLDDNGIPDECDQMITGDMNCDGTVDFFDIEGFVLAVTDAEAYTAAYPDCLLAAADVNGDGLVNFFDIEPFVELIVD